MINIVVDGPLASLRLGPVVEVAVSRLLPGDPLRSEGECPQHVKLLAEAGDTLPPIVVHRPSMQVVDGMHRLRAAQTRALRTVKVRFFDGPAQDAFVLRVQLNAEHGLPLSVSDRRAAATRILGSYPQWSDRRIATVTGLSARTVAQLRAGVVPCPDAGVIEGRIGRDGRVRPLDRHEKRQAAAELIIGNPQLSLRQVARAVGISPETARAVRAEVRRHGTPTATAVATRPAAAVDWAEVVQRLRTDPTLRFTETGRALLRLLDIHTMSSQQWSAILRTVPSHNRPILAKAAAECARVWQLVAERLARQEAMAQHAGQDPEPKRQDLNRNASNRLEHNRNDSKRLESSIRHDTGSDQPADAGRVERQLR